MSQVLLAILTSHGVMHTEGDSNSSDAVRSPLVLVGGLTEDEEEYIRQNATQLGNGAARRTTDLIMTSWALFCSVPVVFQLLVGMALIATCFILPYIAMYISRAIHVPERKTRMSVSLATAVILFCTILVVQAYF